MSISIHIITFVSNITVLLPYNVIIWFGYFIPMSYGIDKHTSQVPLITSFPCSTRFSPGLLFYKKYFINLVLLWSDYLRKIMRFQSKIYFFFQLVAGRVWILLFCLNVFFMAFFTAVLWWNYESIISRFHGIRFCFSSNHVTQQKNSCLENYRWCCFYSFWGD